MVNLKYALHIYLNSIHNVLTHIRTKNTFRTVFTKHNHSIHIQRALHSQLGSSKVFHSWLAFLMPLRSPFASKPEKW